MAGVSRNGSCPRNRRRPRSRSSISPRACSWPRSQASSAPGFAFGPGRGRTAVQAFRRAAARHPCGRSGPALRRSAGGLHHEHHLVPDPNHRNKRGTKIFMDVCDRRLQSGARRRSSRPPLTRPGRRLLSRPPSRHAAGERVPMRSNYLFCAWPARSVPAFFFYTWRDPDGAIQVLS